MKRSDVELLIVQFQEVCRVDSIGEIEAIFLNLITPKLVIAPHLFTHHWITGIGTLRIAPQGRVLLALQPIMTHDMGLPSARSLNDSTKSFRSSIVSSKVPFWFLHR